MTIWLRPYKAPSGFMGMEWGSVADNAVAGMETLDTNARGITDALIRFQQQCD
jgi:hypothetical protein